MLYLITATTNIQRKKFQKRKRKSIQSTKRKATKIKNNPRTKNRIFFNSPFANDLKSLSPSLISPTPKIQDQNFLLPKKN